MDPDDFFANFWETLFAADEEPTGKLFDKVPPKHGSKLNSHLISLAEVLLEHRVRSSIRSNLQKLRFGPKNYLMIKYGPC